MDLKGFKITFKMAIIASSYKLFELLLVYMLIWVLSDKTKISLLSGKYASMLC